MKLNIKSNSFKKLYYNMVKNHCSIRDSIFLSFKSKVKKESRKTMNEINLWSESNALTLPYICEETTWKNDKKIRVSRAKKKQEGSKKGFRVGGWPIQVGHSRKGLGPIRWQRQNSKRRRRTWLPAISLLSIHEALRRSALRAIIGVSCV